MPTTILQTLFRRDLEKLKHEIELYQQEQNIWKIDKNITNSAGNLCLHLVGNLNTYLGVPFGNTSYVRNRDLEFSLKDVPKTELIQMVEDTIVVVEQSLEKVTPEQLQEDYPMEVFDYKMSTAFFLVHLATHLTYHLGQVNYHRRLIDV